MPLYATKEERTEPLIVNINGKTISAACKVRRKPAVFIRENGAIEVPKFLFNEAFTHVVTKRHHFIVLAHMQNAAKRKNIKFEEDYGAICRQKKYCKQFNIPFIPLVDNLRYVPKNLRKKKKMTRAEFNKQFVGPPQRIGRPKKQYK